MALRVAFVHRVAQQEPPGTAQEDQRPLQDQVTVSGEYSYGRRQLPSG